MNILIVLKIRAHMLNICDHMLNVWTYARNMWKSLNFWLFLIFSENSQGFSLRHKDFSEVIRHFRGNEASLTEKGASEAPKGSPGAPRRTPKESRITKSRKYKKWAKNCPKNHGKFDQKTDEKSVQKPQEKPPRKPTGNDAENEHSVQGSHKSCTPVTNVCFLHYLEA